VKSIIRQEFAERLRAARKEKGWTQEDLAEAIKMGERAVSKWEQGLLLPREPAFKRLCSALGKPPVYFTGPRSEVTPTLGELLSVIKNQEHRIQTLEGELAVQRVQQKSESQTPARAGTTPNSGEGIDVRTPKTGQLIMERLLAVVDHQTVENLGLATSLGIDDQEKIFIQSKFKEMLNGISKLQEQQEIEKRNPKKQKVSS
jgi:transcriptional regulator with XRE-family HTH domain